MTKDMQFDSLSVVSKKEKLPGALQTSLEVLFALLDEIQQLGVRVWVHGGWAIDAVTGTARPHKDIDLFAHESDRATLRTHFQSSLIEETIHKLEFAYWTTTVEVTFFQKIGRTRLATLTPRIIVRYSATTFSDATASLGGREIPVVSLPTLYVEVANKIRKKRDMLEKNARDLERLTPYLNDDLRRAAERMFPVPNTWWNRLRLYFGLL